MVTGSTDTLHALYLVSITARKLLHLCIQKKFIKISYQSLKQINSNIPPK